LKLWYIEDINLAERLGILTAGDIYIAYKTIENKSIQINSYNFEVKIFATLDNIIN
jgi:hypothetical protein